MQGVPRKIPESLDKEIQGHLAKVSPSLTALMGLLRNNGVHEFEITLNNGADKLEWNDGLTYVVTPTQEELTNELMAILDAAYPPTSGFSFMNMVWNPNRALAERMAKVVATFRERERQHVEREIVAILTAFRNRP